MRGSEIWWVHYNSRLVEAMAHSSQAETAQYCLVCVTVRYHDKAGPKKELTKHLEKECRDQMWGTIISYNETPNSYLSYYNKIYSIFPLRPPHSGVAFHLKQSTTLEVMCITRCIGVEQGWSNTLHRSVNSRWKVAKARKEPNGHKTTNIIVGQWEWVYDNSSLILTFRALRVNVLEKPALSRKSAT